MSLKTTILQYGKAVLLGVLTLALLVLGILELLPQKTDDLQVKERFRITSAAILADGSLYSSELRGTLRNTTEEALTVSRLVAVVSDGQTKKELSVEDITLARLEDEEVVLSFQGACKFDTVYTLSAEINGKTVELNNRSANDFPISWAAITCGVLLLPAVWLLVRAIKGCYYLHQERKNIANNC